MFTNRPIPAPQRGQKRRHGSEDNSENVSKNNSEDDSGLDDGEVIDSSLDPDYDEY